MDHVRSLLLVLAGVMCFAAPAAAQENPAQTQQSVTEVAGPEHLAAADDLYRSIVLQSGMLDGMLDYTSTTMIPELRTHVMRSPAYQSASAPRREALLRVIDNLPSFMGQEFETHFTALSARVAPRFAALMSAEHLSQTAAFLRSEEMREPWRALLEAAVADKPSAGAFPEWRTVGSFAETDAGRAFAEEKDRLDEILSEEIDQMFVVLLPRMRAIASAQICDALAEDCPTHIREQAGRI